MKKFNLITFAVILMLLPILQSCLDDANNDEWVTCPPGGILAIGTMKIPNADTPRGLFHCVGQWRQCTSGRYGRYTQQEIHCCRRSKSLRWLSADGKREARI